ncbi:MAG TPA: hypothetical protein VFE62_25195 [Gemmataceae bacterium]|nr:hypothetical protein [Gemmataceae bacterium]
MLAQDVRQQFFRLQPPLKEPVVAKLDAASQLSRADDQQQQQNRQTEPQDESNE